MLRRASEVTARYRSPFYEEWSAVADMTDEELSERCRCLDALYYLDRCLGDAMRLCAVRMEIRRRSVGEG